MNLQNTILQSSRLTDTKNSLLDYTNYKHTSVKNPVETIYSNKDEPVYLSNKRVKFSVKDVDSAVCNNYSVLKYALNTTNKYLPPEQKFEKIVSGPESCFDDPGHYICDDISLEQNRNDVSPSNPPFATGGFAFAQNNIPVFGSLAMLNDFEGEEEEHGLVTRKKCSKKAAFADSTESHLFDSFILDRVMQRGERCKPMQSMQQPQFDSRCFSFGAPSVSRFAMPAPGGFATPPRPDFVYDDIPQYCLDFPYSPDNNQEKMLKYLSLENDEEWLCEEKNAMIKNIKMAFVNIVSTSLMCSPNFIKPDDAFRINLIEEIEKVVNIDPEFILKVALYARQELNIRSTSNFLLAYSAYNANVRIFLKKYFSAVINLPSDWLGVAEIYITFKDAHLKPGSLPSVLRKVMVSTFTKFDDYQLAKYNKAKKKKHLPDVSSTIIENKSLTLKKMIRTLHITSPVEPVMSLLGKKYPDNPEDFKKVGLSGSWINEKAGKRMKLPVPETWETRISSEGNKPHVWESLIDHSKLPYMAMLRNLKNLIMSNISAKHHGKVLKKIETKDAVLKSKQFPLRFYAAYKTIQEIESLKTSSTHEEISVSIPHWKRKQQMMIKQRVHKVDVSLLKEYKDALSKALEISVLNNVDPISGRTIVICDIVNAIKENENQADAVMKAYHSCIMLGLVCLKACENCEMKLICDKDTIHNVDMNDQSILGNVSRISSVCMSTKKPVNAENDLIVALKTLLEQYLNPTILLTKKINNIIFLHSSYDINYEKLKTVMNSFLYKYRHLSNPDLLYVQVNINTSFGRGYALKESQHMNDIYLNGFTDHILKFIAAKGGGNQLSFIEAIDEKYNLCLESENSVPVEHNYKKNIVAKVTPYDVPLRWQTISIFISSTFRDMYGERDVLMKCVLPEIKVRAYFMSIFINEIDLRWGITEEYSKSKKFAEICLRAAQNCDIFIGILGERYGTIYNFDAPEDPQFAWIEKHPPGASITELEIEGSVFQQNVASRPHSFFYIRDNNFLNDVPDKYKSSFEAEDEVARDRLTQLKNKVRNSGLPLCDGYSSQWGGLFKDKPFVKGLDTFAKSVFSHVLDTLIDFYGKDPIDEINDELFCQQSQFQLHSYYIEEENSPLKYFANEIKNKHGVFVVTGQPGIGKTTFMVKLMELIGVNSVIPFFIDASSRSRELSFMLNCITYFIIKAYSLPTSFNKIKGDIINQFHDVLIDAAASAGGNLMLFIDGLDHLHCEAQTLDWLPCNIPNGIKIVCSTSVLSLAHTVLKARAYSSSVYSVSLNPLNVSLRKTLVHYFLSQYGKALDEKAFNNQMIQLITKTDCGVPLYIHLTCNYLKVFASYENLMIMIQNFPSTLFGAFEAIIIQMEKSHGSRIVQKALTLLCTVKEGLNEVEFYKLCGYSASYPESEITTTMMKVLSNVVDKTLPALDFQSLLHLIKIFTGDHKKHGSIKLCSPILKEALKKLYVGYDKEVKFCHRLLAAFYDEQINYFTGMDAVPASYVRSLPYHLYYGECYDSLVEILCSLKFLKTAFEVSAIDEIICYYVLILKLQICNELLLTSKQLELLKSFHSFILYNLHILKKYPQVMFQQAINSHHQIKSDFDYVAIDYGDVYIKNHMKLLQHDHRCLTINVLKTATCVSLHETKSYGAFGRQDGYVRVFDHRIGKIISTLKGHCSSVTAICFIGFDRICSASSDNTICIWNFVENFLVAVLKGHTRYISCCITDPNEKFILSSSWDSTIKIWNTNDGSEISTISSVGCPINCIAHHPHFQLIASGLWNGTIEIWNSLSLKRKRVLSGHKSSVKFVAYSADGLNIFSASILSEVYIWSSNEGILIGHLKGHILPVNSIRFPSKSNFFISASDDRTLKVWSNNQQNPLFILDDSKFCPIKFMEIVNSNHLAVLFSNGEVWLIDLMDGHIIEKFGNMPFEVSCFSKYCENANKNTFSSNKSTNLLICGTNSGNIWDMKIGKDHVNVGDLSSPLTSLTHTELFVLAGTSNGDVGFLCLSNESKLNVISGAHDGSVTALSFAVIDGTGMALSASTDMTLKLWKVVCDENISFDLLNTFELSHKDYVSSCCLLPMAHGNDTNVQFVSGSSDNTVCFWNMNWEPLILKGLQAEVINVFCFKNFVIGCSKDGGVAIWTKNGSLISQVKGLDEQIKTVSFNLYQDVFEENVNIIMAFSRINGTIEARKLLQRSPQCTLEGHSKSVTSCSVNDDNIVISCSSDNTVNVWKIPESYNSLITYHEGNIIGIAFNDRNLILSADINGNLLLWKVNEIKDYSSTDSDSKLNNFDYYKLSYVTSKKYVNGYINAFSILEVNKCICALTIFNQEKVQYMISIICIEDVLSDEHKSHILREEQSHYVSDEVTCIDFHQSTNTILIAMKSGKVMLYNFEQKNYINVSNDWILKLFASENSLFTIDLYGTIKEYAFDGLLESKGSDKHKKKVLAFENDNISCLITAVCFYHPENIFDPECLIIGDSNGWIKIITDHVEFEEQIHSDAITGIHVNAFHVITCSLDKSIKVWDIEEHDQVGYFESNFPISCMSVHEDVQFHSKIIVGSTTGKIEIFELLKKTE